MKDKVSQIMAGALASAIVFPPFRLCPAEQQLWHGERLIPLKPKAFSVLHELLQRPARLVSREELLARFWGDAHVGDGVLKTQIAEIRQALGDDARVPRFIETAHRRGYRFVGRIESVTPPLELAETSPVPREFRSSPPQSTAHFVGRDAELAALRTRWQRAARGERQLLLLTGEAGVGKTVLAHAFMQEQQLATPGVLLAWGQCVDQYGVGEPYLPISEALRRLCTAREGERVAECLRRHAPAWLAMQPPAPPQPQADASSRAVSSNAPEYTLRQIAETIEAIGAERPLILLIEDLHWADPSTLDLLEYLAQRSDPSRLFVMGTSRSLSATGGRLARLVHTLEARQRCVELGVPQLSRQAVSDYLTSRFAHHQLPATVPELIHRRTAGNPLFMVGVVDGWVRRGLLKVTPSSCELSASLGELAGCVPESFVRMIERELDQLSPLQRNLVEAASVAGNEFSTAALAAALSEDPVQVEDLCLRWARNGQFFRRMGPTEWQDGTVAERCEFIHALYQQITYDRVGAARRAHLHLRIGERIETGHADQREVVAAELALHFRCGRDYPRAVRYLRLAGEQALRRGAYQEAISHLTQALELVPRLPDSEDKLGIELDLRVLIAPPLRITKGHAAPEVAEAYANAAELCQGRGSAAQRFIVMAGMGAHYILGGRIQAALQIGEELLHLAEGESDSGAITEAHAVIGAAHHHLGQHEAARQHLEGVISFYEANAALAYGNVTALDHGFSARCFLAYSACMMGHPERARVEMLNVLRRARSIANPFATAHALNFNSFIHLLRREPDLATQYADELEDLCREKEIDIFLISARLFRGAAQIERGHLESGTETLRTHIAKFQGTGARAYLKYWMGMLADGYRRMGQTQRGLDVVNAATSELWPERDRIWDAELFRIKGELLIQAEVKSAARAARDTNSAPQDPSAEECLTRALKIARAQGAQLFELRAAVGIAQYWSRRRDRARGKALLSDIYERFTEGLETPDLKAAQSLLAELS